MASSTLLRKDLKMKYTVLMFLVAATAISLAPRYAQSVKIYADGSPIDLQQGSAAPLFTDWDGDGLNDLLVGTFYQGAIVFYKNVGTNEIPVLKYIEHLSAGGVQLKVAFG